MRETVRQRSFEDIYRRHAGIPSHGLQLRTGLTQTRIPCTGCCFSHNRMLAVIMLECAGGVAPPELIKLLRCSKNRAWTWPCELDSRCLCGGTCHLQRNIVSPFHVVRCNSDEVPHCVAPKSPRSRQISAMAEPPTMNGRRFVPSHSSLTCGLSTSCLTKTRQPETTASPPPLQPYPTLLTTGGRPASLLITSIHGTKHALLYLSVYNPRVVVYSFIFLISVSTLVPRSPKSGESL